LRKISKRKKKIITHKKRITKEEIRTDDEEKQNERTIDTEKEARDRI
jgi:hypothetical protein